jgi:hypothetical protein
MSEQQQENIAETQTQAKPSNTPIDAAAAAAALAEAVASASAEKTADRPAASAPKAAEEPAATVKAAAQLAHSAQQTPAAAAKPTLVVVAQNDIPETKSRSGWRSYEKQAAAIAVVVGLGVIGGAYAPPPARVLEHGTPEWIEATNAGIREYRDQLVRLGADVQELKGFIASIKDNLGQARTDTLAQQRAFVDRAAFLERMAEDTSGKLVLLSERSDRAERTGIDAAAQLVAIAQRLDSIERHMAAKAAGADPMPTGSVPEATTAKALPLEGWILHDVQRGVALVESRNGRLHEIVAGQTLPSVGRVEAIERRGKAWVVVTAKGVITNGRWQ